MVVRVLALVVACASVSVGQSRDDRMFERFREEAARYERDLGNVAVRYDGIGNPYVDLRPGFDYATSASAALDILLFSEDGLALLDCTNDQAVQLLTLKAELTRRLRQASRTRYLASTEEESEAREREEREAKAAYAAAWRDTQRILLPHQKRRAEQLVVRHFIREYGWVHTLCYGPLRDILEVAESQRSRLVSRARELYESIEAEALQAERRSLRDLVSTLPIQKRREVERVLNPPLRNSKPAIDLLIWNLDRFVEAPLGDQKEEGDGEGEATGRSKSFSQRGLALAIAAPDQGKIVMSLIPLSRRIVFIIPSHPTGMDLLTILLISSSVQEELELADFQKKAIYKRVREAQILNRDNFGKLSLELGADVAFQVVAELQEPVRRAMLTELLPHQRKRLARIIALRQIRVNGLPQMIVQGNLRELRRVTPQEIRAMQKRAARVASVLKQKRTDWEARVEKELLSLLDADQRKKLERLLGPKLKRDTSWLSLTLAQLRDGVRGEGGLFEAWHTVLAR